MKKTKLLVFLVILCVLLISCVFTKQKNVNMLSIDSVINKYDTMDFSNYKGLHIIYREKRYIREAIFVLSIPKDSLDTIWSGGAIIHNIICFRTMKFKGDSLFRNKIKNNKQNIEKFKSIMKGFRELDLIYLKVNYDGNVFLSPSYYSFERPLLLRVNDSIYPNTEENIRFTNGDGHYTHIKGNWYISDFYLEK